MAESALDAEAVAGSASAGAKVVRGRQKPAFEQVIEGGNELGFDLHRTLPGAQNLVYSPASVGALLAAVEAGGRGETAAEVRVAFHAAGLSEGALARHFGALGVELEGRARSGEGRGGFRWRSVSGLWAAEGLGLAAGYVQDMERAVGLVSRALDFRGDAEGARRQINDEISEATSGRIEELVAPGGVDPSTRLMFTNAVYFHGPWAVPFIEEATEDGEFIVPGEEPVVVPFMRVTDRFRTMRGEGYEVVELPYEGREVAAYVVLPESGKLGEVELGLGAKKLAWIRDQLEARRVEVRLPRFEVRGRLELKGALRSLGVRSLFAEGEADVSGMFEAGAEESVVASGLVHEGVLRVDEAGTEAAAASGVRFSTTSLAGEPSVAFHADRPFLFVVMDQETGAVLFVARVWNPGR